MSDLRPAGIPIQFGGEERHLLFTLNAMDELQDKFDAPMEVIIDKLLDKRESVRTLRTIMTVLVNDEIRRKKHDGETAQEEFTEEELGWLVHGENVVEITMAVIVAYEISLPEPDEFESPNVETGQ